MNSLTFSGHETFPCRQYWLKKGYDFVSNQRSFSSPEAVVDLGVGNNMVRSIRYWLRAFNITDKGDKLTNLAKRIFDDKGWDPFLEDEGTLWLLHYMLNTNGRASIYKIIFTDLRKQKPEFNRKHFLKYVTEKGDKTTEGTLKNDFSVFCRNYLNDNSKGVEEGYSGLLSDLYLLREIKAEKGSVFNIENKERSEIPEEIIFYAILDNKGYGDSISFDNLYLDEDGPGTIFALSKEGLAERLERISERFPKTVVFNNDPLIRELQFKGKKPKPIKVLEDYYGR